MKELVVSVPDEVRQDLSGRHLLRDIDRIGQRTISTGLEWGFTSGFTPFTSPPRAVVGSIFPGKSCEWNIGNSLYQLKTCDALPQIMAHSHPDYNAYFSDLDHTSWQEEPDYVSIYDARTVNIYKPPESRTIQLVVAPNFTGQHHVAVLCQTRQGVDLSSYDGRDLNDRILTNDQYFTNLFHMVINRDRALQKAKDKMGIDTRTFVLDDRGRSEFQQYIFSHLPQELLLTKK